MGGREDEKRGVVMIFRGGEGVWVKHMRVGEMGMSVVGAERGIRERGKCRGKRRGAEM